MNGSARIARNTAVQVAGEITSRAALLCLYVVMARQLGTSGLGDFTFALSLSLVLTMPGGLGIDDVLARAVARRPNDIDRLFWNALAAKLCFGGVGVVVAVVVALVGDFSSSLRVAIVVLAVSGLVEILTPAIYAVFRGLGDLLPEAVGLLIQRVCRAVAGLVVVLAGLGVDAVALVYLGGAIAALVYASITLARRARPQLSLSRDSSRTLVLAALPIGIGLIFDVVLWRVDTVILGAIKDETAVGLYGASTRLIEAPLFLGAAFVAALVPILSRLTPTTDPPAGQVYEVGLKVLTAALTPIAACFVVFAEPLMRLIYGEPFTEAASATRLLGPIIVVIGLAQLSSYLLISQNRQRVIPWIAAVISAENIGLNFLLVPGHSFDGAALAALLSEITYAATLGLFAVRAVGRVSVRRVALGPALACGALVGVGLAGGSRLPLLPVAVLVYFVVLAGLERLLYPDDVGLAARAVTGPLRARSSSSSGPPDT